MRPLHLTAALLGLAGTTLAGDGVTLNEIYASHTGTDDQEFIEIKGPAGYDLNRHVVCIVEGDGGGAGTLDRVWDLTGNVIPPSGYFVLGDSGVSPVDFVTGTSNTIENGTETVYLIGALNPLDIDNLLGSNVVISGTDTLLGDGSLGVVLDSIGLVDGGFGNGDQVFDGVETIGPDGSFFPAGVFRNGDEDWCASQFLDFDDVANADVPRTPGAANFVGDCLDLLRFTEILYSGEGSEFAELTNVGGLTVDLTGYTFDDSSADPNDADAYDLSGLGSLAPGESLLIIEADAASFNADWGLSGVQIAESSTADLGRNDALNLFNDGDVLVTSLAYGDEDVPGSFRSQGVSLWVHGDDLDSVDTLEWEASFPGDDQGGSQSLQGDWGSPGSWTPLDGDGRGEWRNEGNGLSGDDSPDLAAGGDLAGGSQIGIRTWDGTPGGTLLFINGLTAIDAGFKGGVLVPAPDFITFATFDGFGSFEILAAWPPVGGAPSGFEVYTQVWAVDAGGPVGFSASNAVMLVTP